MPKLIPIGKIISTHGLHGNVKISSFSDHPENIKNYILYSGKNEEFAVEKIINIKKHLITAKLKDINSIEAAEKLKNTELFIKREDLPEITDKNEFYQTDLIGFEARKTSGTIFGKVIAFYNFGAGDIVEIKLAQTDQTEMFSFRDEIFPEINVESGYLLINPPEEIIAKEK